MIVTLHLYMSRVLLEQHAVN